jgi:hypothetical protein
MRTAAHCSVDRSETLVGEVQFPPLLLYGNTRRETGFAGVRAYVGGVHARRPVGKEVAKEQFPQGPAQRPETRDCGIGAG